MPYPSSRRVIRLVDTRDKRRLVEAYVYRDFPAIELEHIESTWATARDQATEQGISRGLSSLEHSHWDWRNKVHSVEAGHHRLVAVESRSQVQGIMAVLQTRSAQSFPTCRCSMWITLKQRLGISGVGQILLDLWVLALFWSQKPSISV